MLNWRNIVHKCTWRHYFRLGKNCKARFAVFSEIDRLSNYSSEKKKIKSSNFSINWSNTNLHFILASCLNVPYAACTICIPRAFEKNRKLSSCTLIALLMLICYNLPTISNIWVPYEYAAAPKETYNIAKQFFSFLFNNKVFSTGSQCVKQMVKG